MFHKPEFRPCPGFYSPHIQTVSTRFILAGKAPPTTPFLISLPDKDTMCCEVSTPPDWKPDQKTILLIHGLGGSHRSTYMVRMSRKFYKVGYKVVRVNLRGTGSGRGLAHLPYHAGISSDILLLIQKLKEQHPTSPISVVGFSLGGNVALKLAGEQKEQTLIQHTIAICPPIDLEQTSNLLMLPSNRFYHNYYLNQLKQEASRWPDLKPIHSMRDFDNTIIAPLWGFQNDHDYYRKCSSLSFLPSIQHKCELLFAADDPFINYRPALECDLHHNVKVSLCAHGGHMGFLGWAGWKHRFTWLDSFILSRIQANP